MENILLQKYQNILGSTIGQDSTAEDIIEYIINYHEEIIHCMPGNVYWLDKDARAIGCNQNVLTMFGLSSYEEFKGLSFEEMSKIGDWSHEAEQSFKKDTLEVIETGQAKLNVEEPPIPHANGKAVYFLTSRVPLFDHAKNVLGVVGISIDITDLKEAESALIQAKKHAEQAGQAKTQFIQNIEHDLRTPFCGIWSLTDVLLQQETDSGKKELLQMISSSAKELYDYHNEILDFSNTEMHTRLVLEKKLDFKKIFESVIAIEKPAAHAKALDFLFEYDENIPQTLLGDEYRVQRILINLVSNAIKFTHTGYIQLTARVAKRVNQRCIILELAVTDTGVGIDKDKQNFIYEKFSKVMASNKGLHKGRPGLGLPIVKQFIADLGGEIDLESEPGKGSKFTCLLEFGIPLLERL